MPWWVVNKVTRPGGARGPQQTNYVVEEDASEPVNEVAGPFSTESAAKAWQTGANTAGNSPGSVAGGIADATGINAIGDFFGKLGEKNTWLRVIEVAIGGMILYVGLKAMFPQAINTVTSKAKKAGEAAMFL